MKRKQNVLAKYREIANILRDHGPELHHSIIRSYLIQRKHATERFTLKDMYNFLYHHSKARRCPFQYGNRRGYFILKNRHQQKPAQLNIAGLTIFPRDARDRQMVKSDLKKQWKGGTTEEYLAIDWAYDQLYLAFKK